MSPSISLTGVQVAAGDRVLLDVPRLRIEPGERVAIVGPNGAGKSTFLKLIGGLVKAHQGDVQVLGRALGPGLSAAERRALRRDTGLLMQGLHLVPRLSARENVLIGALARLSGAQAVRSLFRWYPQDLVAEADAALAALGLGDRADTRADRLSGGERQKVALARLQLQQPRLLLADEPTSALDPAATQAVCYALTAVAAAPGRTLLTIVHDLELLPLLATRVIGMADGRVRFDRPLGEAAPALLQSLYERQTAEAAPAALSDLSPVIRLASA
ncbi:MAG TPA: ATP-binding cassette domain-containing protein [Rubrivivax sp.]|nr:ATP-binding cassette domain-containing protein [Rubrivivax sp.]